MPTNPEPVTLAEVVHKAVEVCANGSQDALDGLEQKFEDADEPIAAIEDIEQTLNERLGPPELDDHETEQAFAMARAVIVYLAYRRDQLSTEPTELLRLAARAEFDGDPPTAVRQWLAAHGATH
jgi:hypothetical protein